MGTALLYTAGSPTKKAGFSRVGAAVVGYHKGKEVFARSMAMGGQAEVHDAEMAGFIIWANKVRKATPQSHRSCCTSHLRPQPTARATVCPHLQPEKYEVRQSGPKTHCRGRDAHDTARYKGMTEQTGFPRERPKNHGSHQLKRHAPMPYDKRRCRYSVHGQGSGIISEGLMPIQGGPSIIGTDRTLPRTGKRSLFHFRTGTRTPSVHRPVSKAVLLKGCSWSEGMKTTGICSGKHCLNFHYRNPARPKWNRSTGQTPRQMRNIRSGRVYTAPLPSFSEEPGPSEGIV